MSDKKEEPVKTRQIKVEGQTLNTHFSIDVRSDDDDLAVVEGKAIALFNMITGGSN